MSHEWNALLPDLNAEFTELTLKRRAPTEAEIVRLQALKTLAEGNCREILYGLAAAGEAVANAPGELSEGQVGHFGYLVQLLATLSADLAQIDGFVSPILNALPEEKPHVEA